jgi:hypothetical protein
MWTEATLRTSLMSVTYVGKLTDEQQVGTHWTINSMNSIVLKEISGR